MMAYKDYFKASTYMEGESKLTGRVIYKAFEMMGVNMSQEHTVRDKALSYWHNPCK